MTTFSDAEREMVEGYIDGLDLLSPEPSDNRSRSYRHGFANGRRDRLGETAYARLQRTLANEAMRKDMET